jgi:hypothetical protein
MNACLRYWQAVLRAAEAELDAATTNSDLRIAARKVMRARRQLAHLSAHQPPPSYQTARSPSHDQP